VTLHKPGTQLRSAVCDTEVVVVRPPTAEVTIECGGAPMVERAVAGDPTGTPAADRAAGTELGKRYVHEASSLEVLCTKPGAGSLSVGDELLTLKGSKPLPASD
jgi:hypothetical protein